MNKRIFRSKKAFEMSFAWMFSIITGAIILFLAIYMTMQFIAPQRHISQSELARSLSALLDPLETGKGVAVESTVIELAREARIYNKCYMSDENDNFGRQGISMATKSGIGKQWQTPGEETSLQNKYIFSNSTVKGKNFYIMVKQFEMPFKVADLIFLYDEKYCFVSPPRWIEDDVGNAKNIKINDATSGCEEGSITICFSSYGCDVDVADYSNDNSFSSGSLEKDGYTMVYSGSLIYAAIFSDSGMYECNLARLMARLEKLAKLYLEKSRLIEPECSSGLNTELADLANKAMALKQEDNPSQHLADVISIADDINDKNSICRIF